ncbi:MAG: hypothetical protein FWD24_09330 [Treponema sp.]|nr:hypothetical protein [Treponema sp.]
MDVTYRLKPEELNDNFFMNLKQLFFGKEIAITVEEVLDETEYLLSNEANREHLIRAVDDMKHGRNVHTMSTEEMESMI